MSLLLTGHSLHQVSRGLTLTPVLLTPVKERFCDVIAEPRLMITAPDHLLPGCVKGSDTIEVAYLTVWIRPYIDQMEGSVWMGDTKVRIDAGCRAS